MFGTGGASRKPEDLVDGTHRWNGGRYGRPFCVIVFRAQLVIHRSSLSHMLDIKVATWSSILVREKFDRCSIVISGHTFFSDSDSDNDQII